MPQQSHSKTGPVVDSTDSSDEAAALDYVQNCLEHSSSDGDNGAALVHWWAENPMPEMSSDGDSELERLRQGILKAAHPDESDESESEGQDDCDDDDDLSAFEPARKRGQQRPRAQGTRTSRSSVGEELGTGRAAKVDLWSVSREFQDYVLGDEDIRALAPMDRGSQRLVRRLALAFSLDARSQGSGRHSFLLLHRTKTSAVPAPGALRDAIVALGGPDVPGGRRAATQLQQERARKNKVIPEKEGGRSRRGKKSKDAKKTPNPPPKPRRKFADRPVAFQAGGVHGESGQDTAGQEDDQAPFNYQPTHLAMDTADFGLFERHTTGFGSRMLAKMGFSGGLGARSQGMQTPLAASVRPKRLGLGAQSDTET